MKTLSIECPNLTCIINQSWPGCIGTRVVIGYSFYHLFLSLTQICHCKINHFQASKVGIFLLGDPRGGAIGQNEFLIWFSDFFEDLGNWGILDFFLRMWRRKISKNPRGWRSPGSSLGTLLIRKLICLSFCNKIWCHCLRIWRQI